MPTVGNLPTIFESYAYPLIIEEFLSGAETETRSVSSTEIETPELIDMEPAITQSRKVEPDINSSLNQETALMPTIKTEWDLIPLLNEEPNSTPTIEIELDRATTIKIESNSTSPIKEIALMSTINVHSDVSSVVEK